VPSIATAHASFPDLIEPDRDGLLVPPGDPAALAAALAQIDASPSSAASMGRAARASYELRYTPEQNLRMLEDIYAGVLRGSGADEPPARCPH
jgi:glycosyltransferase involved in cell wall biosynthesis